MKLLAGFLGVILVGMLSFLVARDVKAATLPATPITPVVRVVTVVCHSTTPRSLPYDCRNVHGAWLPLTSTPGPAPMLKPGRPSAPIVA